MLGTGTSEAKEPLEKEMIDTLPQFAVVAIRNQALYPDGKVEVTPNAGRIVFRNEDPIEYRIRFYKPDTDPNADGIDLLLPAGGSLSLIIRKDDAFMYSVMNINSENAMTGKGGGPGQN